MICIFILILFVSSCSSQKNGIEDFPREYYISEYDSVYSDVNDVLSDVTDIEIDGELIVLKHRRDEYNFSFIDLRTGNLLNRWARVGQGPNEFVQLGAGFSIVDSTLVFLDIARKGIYKVPITDILRNEVKHVERIPYPYTREFRPMRFTVVDDNVYFLGAFVGGRLGGMNLSSDSVFIFSDYKFDCSEIPDLQRGVVYQGLLKGNTKQDKFVCLTYSSDLFEIYSCKENDVKRIYFYPYQQVPNVTHIDNRFLLDYENNIVGLNKMSVSDDLICFMYSSLENVESDGLFSEILCFDWEGNKIVKYILPFSIKNFCVDGKCIYGIRNVKEDMVLYRFEMNGIESLLREG